VKRLLLLAGLAQSLAGCGTILDAAGASRKGPSDPPGPPLHGGVPPDVPIIGDPVDGFGQRVPFFVLDVPLSAALDTAFLPFTVPWALAQ